MRALKQILLVFGFLLAAPVGSFAQQYRYMDDAGNIFFVDNVKKVPARYRDQVIVPTPAPVLTQDQIEALRRKQRKDEQDRQDQEEARDRDRKQRQRQADEQRHVDDRQIRQMDDSRQLDRITQ